LSELKEKNYQRFYAEEYDREFDRIRRKNIEINGMAEEQAEKEAKDLMFESNKIIKGKALKRVKDRIPDTITEASIVIIEGMLAAGQNEQLFVTETVEDLDRILGL
jgi:hypothetical protein